MEKITIEAQPWVLETAASILRTYSNRGPSNDRDAISKIADEFDRFVSAAKFRLEYEATESSRREFPSGE